MTNTCKIKSTNGFVFFLFFIYILILEICVKKIVFYAWAHVDICWFEIKSIHVV